MLLSLSDVEGLTFNDLDNRLFEISEWCAYAMGHASKIRFYCLNKLYESTSPNRSELLRMVEKKYFERMIEIEEIESKYRQAYDQARALIAENAIYPNLTPDEIRKTFGDDSARRREIRLAEAHAKSVKFAEREARRKIRLERKGKLQ